ncbi:MAG TPA: IS21 family transposase [Steroidobacteraceae bacterium]|nr:IS21 family transposase [Steroidobacteraceae bacterium]
MISRELEAEILRLYHAEHWPIGTLARQLGIHHDTVRRVLTQAGIPAAKQSTRPSMADPFVPFIQASLAEYPTLRASRLYQMVRERGYPGRPDHFRAIVARYRPRPTAEAYLRLRTLPGDQGQTDWAHFGRFAVGRALRPLMAFVMVLSYSRYLFLRFYQGAAMSAFLDGHVRAFTFFNAVPRTLLYDNLRSAVLERVHLERVPDAIRFHPTLLELSAWYRFAPRPVAVARGNEKGRVERAIRFVRERFFAARRFADLEDLNAQALAWCAGEAAERPCPEDRRRTVRECFEAERARLLALPEEPFPAAERVIVRAHKTPYVRFDLNDYSVPHTHVRRTLEVLASVETVRILDGNTVIATHRRSFDRGAQIEQAAHIEALEAKKRAARAHRAIDRLHYAAPSAARFFQLAASRGVHLGSLTRGLIELLDAHGAAALEAALAAALGQDATHLAAVRHFVDLHRAQRGASPAIPVTLPDDPRVRKVAVRPHNLAEYETLARETSDERSDASPHTAPAKPDDDNSGGNGPAA